MFRRATPRVLAVAIAASVALVAACSSQRAKFVWDRQLLEATRDHDRGRLQRAERAYRRLLKAADNAEDRRAARLHLARLAVDRGNPDVALERYRAIWEGPERDSYGARAMWEARELVDADRGMDLVERLVVRYPRTSWAESGVDLIVDARCARHCTGLAEWVETTHPKVENTPVADNVFFEPALALLERAGRTDAAIEMFRDQLDRYPDGSLADDAEWELANIYVDRQNWELARHYLQRVAARVEVSRFVGTFNSPWAADARYKLGWIHLTHLDDYKRAAEHFEQYLKDFSSTARADDALWHMAEAHRLGGRRDAYRDALRRLGREFPESRHVEAAQRRLREDLGP